MTCELVLRAIPLYFYGELSPADEDRVEEHLHTCAACAGEMERQRTLAAALDRNRADVSMSLLEDCRADLMAAIEGGAPRSVPGAGASPWKLFLDAMAHSLAGPGRWQQPAGAVALLAIGFFAARFTGFVSGAAQQASLAPSDQIVHTIRSIQPESSGQVQINFDETQRRTVSGRMDDANIQRLLLAAAREENPAVRVESVDLLKNRPASSEVRSALLNAAAHDPNPGVRLKAVEGLKPLAGDPEIRKTLAQVLLKDDNPAIRMQVVDVLVEHSDDNIVGVLQDLMQKEDNSYVRLKSEKALKAMNASVGTF
ncbi:MAG TPA: HEAT repeat domain-containing protein [Bryobacteraceae bacterium]|nr:HEAT repeat domain-containing protein [Bryobacteraceae bacterium]